MTSDVAANLPRKKRSILWWLLGVFLLLVGLFFFQLFGPDPRILVSPQTTYITAPLRPDGLPDYEEYILELYREGVTPENNAATLIWEALWPGELDPTQHAAVARELGWTGIPSEKDALDSFHSNQSAVAAWLSNPAANLTNDESAVAESPASESPMSDEQYESQRLTEISAERLLDQAMSRPWTSRAIPPLGRWVDANEKPLDLLVEASRRPRCYFPSPSLLDDKNETLIAMLLPGQQTVREGGRSLAARAMWHVGEDRVNEAWQDLLAAHRIARLTAQGHTLIEQLVGIAIDGIACDATITLLDQGKPSAEQARQILRDLTGLSQHSAMADSLDRMERMCFLDMVTRFNRMDKEALEMLEVGEQVSLLNTVTIDWNIVLRRGNEYFDRMAAAGRLPSRDAREQAIAQIYADLAQLEKQLQSPATFVAAAVSPTRRSELIASIMLNLFLPAMNAALAAQDRGNAKLQLTCLAAALAVYRAEQGSYPEKLDQLTPTVLETLPVDIYNNKPFFYQKVDDGYLLYSAGENGGDEGGSNEQQDIYLGQPLDWFDEAEAETYRSKIPADSDDISIRVPRPSLKLPRIPADPGEP